MERITIKISKNGVDIAREGKSCLSTAIICMITELLEEFGYELENMQ